MAWKSLFANRIYLRGVDYADRDLVHDLHTDQNGMFSATVAGSQEYYVTGRYKNGRASGLHCTCPYAQDGHRCKHMAAVLTTIDRHQKQPRDGSQSTSKKSLTEVLSGNIEPGRLPIDPMKLLEGHKYPVQLLDKVFDHLDSLYIMDERVTSMRPFTSSILPEQWHFTLTGEFGQDYFAVEIDFDQHHILSVDNDYSENGLDAKIVEILGLYELSNYLATHNLLEATNDAARHMLELYHHPNVDSDPVRIAAHLDHFYEGEPYIYFRAGIPDHMYKLQNLNSFTQAVNWGNPIHLGKFFDQVIDPNQLDASSAQWLDLLDRVSSAVELADDDYYNDTKIPNRLPLTGRMADDVDLVLRKGGILNDDRLHVQLKRQEESFNPQVVVATEGKPDDPTRKITVNLQMPDDLIVGRDAYYKIDLGNWVAMTGVTPNELGRTMLLGRTLEFGTDTMTEFTQQVLPELQEQFNVKIKGNQDLDEFVPKVPQIIFLLDYRDQTIFCQLAVKQGDKLVALREVDPGTLPQSYLDRAISQIANYFRHGEGAQPDEIVLPLAEADDFLSGGWKDFKQAGEVRVTKEFDRLLHQPPTKLSVGVRLQSNLLDLDVTGNELSPEEVQQLLADYQPQRRYYQLGNRIVKVDQPSIEELQGLTEQLGVSINDFTQGKLTIPSYRALYLDNLLGQQQVLDYQRNQELEDLVKSVGQQHNKIEPPEDLQATLRPYQLAGFRWLSSLVHYHFGGLLADEMGLGKTLQVITLILAHHLEGQSIVIVPAAVLYNWQHEFQKFAPQLQVAVLDGSKAERAAQFAKAHDNDVIITSYDAAKRDVDLYDGQHFNIEVIDEAQYIKNPRTSAAKIVKAINADYRFALTGTPIENRLSELWSIFDYLMPGLLGTYKDFKKRYENPIIKDQDRKAQADLQRLIGPFVLRRLKKDVLADLPDKEEQVVSTPMVGKQAKLYQARAQALVKQLKGQDEEEFRQNKIAILAEITKLRELCCSPQLLDPAYHGHSGKVDTTMDLITREITGGHKILLFSQFTSALAILQKQLVESGINYFLIEGQTKKADRIKYVNEFNAAKEPAVFLISLKAGGTGLNLTGADVVIHFDPWWNVAAENQATDRAHRIGQHHNVMIYKLIAKNTIEERIVAMQQQKEKLADSILSGKEVANSVIDRETLMKILQ